MGGDEMGGVTWSPTPACSASSSMVSHEKIGRLRGQLNETRLKLLAALGEILTLRRQLGEFSDDWPFSEEDV